MLLIVVASAGKIKWAKQTIKMYVIYSVKRNYNFFQAMHGFEMYAFCEKN